MDFKELLEKDKFIVFIDDLNIISVYDSYRYSYNDYNVVSASQRNYLINKLKILSFKQISGQIITDQVKKVIFVKSSSLGVSPLIEIQRMKRNQLSPKDIIVVSPVTAALIICQNYLVINEQKAIELLSKLITKCPINLEQFEIFARDTDFYDQLRKYLNELTNIQNKVIEEKFKGRTIKLS